MLACLILVNVLDVEAQKVESIGMNQKSITFAGENFLAGHKNFTYRQSGFAVWNNGQGPQHMYSIATKDPIVADTDNFFLSYHSFYTPSELGPAPDYWSELYHSQPEFITLQRDYVYYGLVSRFSKRSTDDVVFEETISFKEKCETVHGMTASKNGQLIALMCRGYPGPGELKDHVKDPFPESDFTDLTPTSGNFTDGPHLASMYILEFHNGRISTTPDHVIRVSKAAGGWNYANNEIDFVCDSAQGCDCDVSGTCEGGSYFVHLKVQTNNPNNNHENIYKYIVNRPDNSNNPTYNRQFAREGCGGGHVRKNRAAYNSVQKAWGSTCNLDACLDPNHPNPDPGNSSCSSTYLRTLPTDAMGGDQSNYTNTFMNINLQPAGNDNWSSGGSFTLLSLGQDGYMNLLSGPGDVHQESPKIGFYFHRLPGQGTDELKWNIDRDLMVANGITDTGRFGFAKGAPYGSVGAENHEQSERFLIGFSPKIDPTDSNGGNRQKGKPEVYMVGEFDRSGEPVGHMMQLDSAGWGEEDNWSTLPSTGCVAFAFAWKNGVDGRAGYPPYAQILSDDVTTPADTLFTNRGFTKKIQLTTICPDSVSGNEDLIFQAGFELDLN